VLSARRNANAVPRQPARPACPEHETIRAALTGANTATAGAISVTTRTPILSMCRTLLANNFDPRTRLEAVRGDVVCLIVSSIKAAAALTVDEHSGPPRFIAWQPFPAARVRP
jgi:hypothetical protein